MADDDINLTPQEEQELNDYLENRGYPKQEEKFGAFKLLETLLKEKENFKSANLKEEEIAAIRIYLNGALFFDKMGFKQVSSYLTGKAQVIAAPTLSRDATFIQAIITQKRELATKTKTGGENKGWFKRKEKT